MSAYTPSHVFASMPTPGKKQLQTDENASDNILPLSQAKISDRHITVTAVGEVSLPPDRSKLVVRVRSQKEDIQDVKNSITRRMDYIIQTFHNHNLKDSDMQIFKTIRRTENIYTMETEVQAVFVDFHKCQTVSNLLVEKLDESVTVCLAEFYHSSNTLQNIRQQASLLAIHNAKQKAQEMAKFVHQTVGHPISIQEQETKEWSGSQDTPTDIESTKTIQQRLTDATVTVTSKVAVCFELKAKVKSKAYR